jgi:hypothetical protein
MEMVCAAGAAPPEVAWNARDCGETARDADGATTVSVTPMDAGLLFAPVADI